MNARKNSYRPSCDVLEDRCLMTTASLSGGLLRINGSDRAETINITRSGSLVRVSGLRNTFQVNQVQQIRVTGLGGDDTISIDQRLTQRSVLHGGAGDDTIYGGSGRDTLHGNSGDDRLLGRLGNDSLCGHDGTDRMEGGAGHDSYRETYNPNALAIDGALPSDIRQQDSLTCQILATLAALSAAGEDLISQISYRGQHRFALPLHRRGTGWVTQSVYFDGSWTDHDPMPATDGEAWVILYQRAYLQEMRAQGADSQLVHKPLEAITAREVRHGGSPAGLSSADLDRLRAALANQRAVIAATKEMDAQLADSRLRPWHAYTILEVSQEGGEVWVTLRDPSGTDDNGRGTTDGRNDGVLRVRWADFSQSFDYYCYA
jgi:hypothetical protein